MQRVFIGIDEVGRAARRRWGGPRPTTVIGIDEVGRGALAGPVVLAAVSSRSARAWRHPKLGRIRDSKKLSPKRREHWAVYLQTHPAVSWKIARVTPRVIDRINISQAANLAARRLVSRLALRERSYFVYLDGGLILPDGIPHETIIRGDEQVPAIAAASIIAKVWRDRFMKRLGRKFPHYKFSVHKGYGTRDHRTAILRHGFSEAHRQSFVLSSIVSST